eukprot:4102408-Pyramimonas_sp.AAC.1
MFGRPRSILHELLQVFLRVSDLLLVVPLHREMLRFLTSQYRNFPPSNRGRPAGPEGRMSPAEPIPASKSPGVPQRLERHRAERPRA